jgi:hypothetical protein
MPLHLITHSWKNGGDDSKKPVVGVQENGRFLIVSDADVDADGSPNAAKIDLGSGQGETSLRKSNGWLGTTAYCNSEIIPYFVLPLNWVKVTGDVKSHLGDMAKISYKDKYIYAIFADFGPNHLIGEASICAIEHLGFNPWNKTKTKVTSGIPHGVTYDILSGSANLARTYDFESIQLYGKELFENQEPKAPPKPLPVEASNGAKFAEFFKENFLAVDREVERWFAKKYSPNGTKNACVAHVTSCLNLVKMIHPTLGTTASINVDHFFAWALKNGYTKIEDIKALLPGDICVSGPTATSFDHVYTFLKYADSDYAEILDNQAVGVHKRSLSGKGCGKWRFAIRMG